MSPIDDPRPTDDDAALAAEYVLGLMDDTERAAFEMRLSAEPALRDAVASWADHFATLADDLPETPPPAGLFGRVETALFGTTRPGLWRQLLPYLLGATAAAGLAWIVVTTGLLTPEPSAPDLRAELAPLDAADVRLDAVYDSGRQALVVTRLGGAPPADGVHELWLIVGEQAPLSLGLLDRAGRTAITLPPALADALAGATLAVSEEPPGGSTTGAPTGPVRAAGGLTTS